MPWEEIGSDRKKEGDIEIEMTNGYKSKDSFYPDPEEILGGQDRLTQVTRNHGRR